jgi:hypothetical protein
MSRPGGCGVIDRLEAGPIDRFGNTLHADARSRLR